MNDNTSKTISDENSKPSWHYSDDHVSANFGDAIFMLILRVYVCKPQSTKCIPQFVFHMMKAHGIYKFSVMNHERIAPSLELGEKKWCGDTITAKGKEKWNTHFTNERSTNEVQKPLGTRPSRQQLVIKIVCSLGVKISDVDQKNSNKGKRKRHSRVWTVDRNHH